MMRRLILVLALIFAALPALAAIAPDEIMSDPALEARARGITKQLRCLVCQNQSIDDSNAPLARDLRLLVRERLKAGDGDDAAIAYVVARYGDFVLLRPPIKATTWLLVRRPKVAPAAPAPLDPEEEKKLAALMGESQPKAGP
jgi:cytochrome c-type biogenesis protein CcmH